MKTITKVGIFLAGALSTLFLILGTEKIINASKYLQEYKHTKQEMHYLHEAALLSDCIYREHLPVSATAVKEMLVQIDKLLPKYFPNGPYTREDFIAMGWLESAFNQYETGTHGEKGIFQIMPGEFKECHIKNKNKYDIDINTQLCMYVLKAKFDKYPDYKKAIIAYNGVVITKKGKWNEKYWRAFEKRRNAVGTLLSSNAIS